MSPSAFHRLRWPVLAALVTAGAACGGSPTGEQPVCGEEFALDLGDIVGGRLETSDRRLAGAYIDYYSLELDGSAAVTVALSSTEMDPLVVVFIESDTTVQGFDSIGAPPGMEETARWSTPDSAPLPAGCHLIGASSWYPDSTGGYTLSVDGTPLP